jgi:tetratricopeptide (TPR) repeat protein
MAAGMNAANAGNLGEARRQFARAVALEPKIAEGHAALGSVLLSLGEAERAAQELETAHRLSPADTSVDLNLANAEVARGHYPEAVKLFDAALGGSPIPELSPQDSISFATALTATEEPTRAESVLRSAASSAPDLAEVNDALGVVLAKRGELGEGLQYFQRAVVLNPRLTQAQAHLGSALLALNRPEQAIPPLETVAAAAPQDFRTQLMLGRALSSAHRDAEALIALHRAAKLRNSASSADALYALALALQASGDPAGALPMFEAATASGTPTSAMLTNYALARVQTGDARGALPMYAQALAMGLDSATLRQDYGVAYLQQADLDHAIEQFQKGLVLDPNDASLHYNLALALKLKDNLAAAVPEFELAAEIDPRLPDPPYTLGVLYMQQGRFSDAAAQFRRATTLQPKNGDAWALLGSVLKDSGDSAGAVDALKRAVVLQPDQPGLHIQLAALELQAGDKEAAAAERRIAADLSRAAVSRQRASFALKSGRSLLADGKIEDAIRQLTIAIQADPSLSEPHRLLADAYERQGKGAEAALERQKAATVEAANKVQRQTQP